MSENTIAKGLRFAANKAKARSDNSNYECGVTIAEADLAANEIERLAAELARLTAENAEKDAEIKRLTGVCNRWGENYQSWVDASKEKDAEIERLRGERERYRVMVQMLPDQLREWWSFDQYQIHTHSWHDREDFLKKWNEGVQHIEAAEATREGGE